LTDYNKYKEKDSDEEEKDLYATAVQAGNMGRERRIAMKEARSKGSNKGEN
jgi:hypothetical protein